VSSLQPAQQSVFASAARTATAASATFANQFGHRGLHLVIDATAITSSPSVVFTIQGYSPLGDDYYTILASAAVVSAATSVLRVYPGLAGVNNLAISDCLPALYRVNAVHGNSDSITYSVNAILLP
jgi:hypothetical protein